MAWHLAGFDVLAGATGRAPEVSARASPWRKRGRTPSPGRYGVPGDRSQHAHSLAARGRAAHPLCAGCRDPAEYRAGHLPGAVMAPGGQLVQETDSWLGVWGARVVLVDDTGVRARMTASWLRAWAGMRRCSTAGSTAWSRSPACRRRAATSSRSPVPSRRRCGYGAAGEPGGRGRLGAEPSPPGAPHSGSLVRDPRPGSPRRWEIASGRRAGAGERRRHDRPLCRCRAAHPPAGQGARWRDRGVAGRRAAARTGMDRLASEPDDVSLSARDRPPAERERYMREYLAWEIDLVNQIARDTRLPLPPRPVAG